MPVRLQDGCDIQPGVRPAAPADLLAEAGPGRVPPRPRLPAHHRFEAGSVRAVRNASLGLLCCQGTGCVPGVAVGLVGGLQLFSIHQTANPGWSEQKYAWWVF